MYFLRDGTILLVLYCLSFKIKYIRLTERSRADDVLSKFRSSQEISVLMMSLDHAASGTNITEAYHIIFVQFQQCKLNIFQQNNPKS